MSNTMSPAAKLLDDQIRKLLQGQSRTDQVKAECERQFRFLNKYLNPRARITNEQAFDIAAMIVGRAENQRGISFMEIIQIATFINSCDLGGH